MARPTSSSTSAKDAAEAKALKKRFETRVRLSWLALFAERAWEGLLWPFVVVSCFLVFTLLGGWSLLPRSVNKIGRAHV